MFSLGINWNWQAILFAILSLLRQFSIRNNSTQTILSLNMFATGLSRQGFDILSRMGVVVSYSSLVRNQGTTTARGKRRSAGSVVATRKTSPKKPGILRSLSDACRAQAREIMKTQACALTYDNINMVFKVAEQVIGRIG
jgi:hypothetical protein